MLSCETTSLDERRAHARFEVQLALNIDTSSRQGRFGVVRNASAGGLLFQTPSRFSEGESLSLTVLLPRGLAIMSNARVLRATHLDSVNPWRCLVAAEFDEPAPLLGEVLRTLAAKGHPSSRGMQAARGSS
jgi:hypothetical protein